METMNTLRKSQSLRSLSGFGVKERSWETSKSSLWDNKKSVSQLVQHYQSCVELSTSETNEEKIKVCNASLSFSSPREEMSVGLVSPWRRLESRGDQVDRLGTDSGSFLLSRSRSMDHLPQRDRAPEGTSALRALFESKATLQEDFYSSTRLNIASPASRMVAGIQSSEMEKDRPLGARRGYSTEETNGRKDNTQRAVQGERRKTISGVPESSVRGSRITTPDDKRSLQLSYRDTPSRQGRDRERTSSSVRDRSALYLSRVAAAESPGSSTHTKSSSSSGKRTTGSKFQSPEKEICSACLTPVYPMEKMVANKLVLHNSCFCCKHCKKKLSIRNYSSLYGEFYCISHYDQLFKRKGNYDEGFGHKQHKDRWLPKPQEPEPDNKNDKKIPKGSTRSKGPKANMAVGDPKANMTVGDFLDGLPEPSAGVSQGKSVREPISNSSPDSRNKLKHSWPPEKKWTGVSRSSAQQVNTPRPIVPVTDTPTQERSLINHRSENLAGKNTPKRNQVEVRKEVLSEQDKIHPTATASGRREISKTDVIDSPEAPRTEKTRPWSVSSKRALFQQETVTTVKTVVSSSRTMPGSSVTTTKQKTEQVKSTPSAVKKYISISDGKTDSAGKTKKSVRFSPSLDDDLDKEDSPSASELNSDRENQNQNGHPGYASVEEIDNNITMKQRHLSVEAEEREVQSEAIYNPYQYNSDEKITDPYEYNSHEKMEGLKGEHVDRAQASVAEHAGIGVSQENTQSEVPVAVNTNSESLNGLLLTSDMVDNPHVVQVNDHSTPEATTVNLPEPAGMMDIGAEQFEQSDSVDQKVRESEPNLDEKNRTNNENQLDGSDEVQQQERTVDQSKGAGRSNSSKSKQNEKTPMKKGGSWSNRKSPLSKLFTSGGNEKTNKAETTDKKKPDAKPRSILGKLFQSSPDKRQDLKKTQETKADTEDERKETVNVQTEEKHAEGMKDEVFDTEKGTGGDLALEQPEGVSNVIENCFSEDLIPFNSVLIEGNTTDTLPSLESTIPLIVPDFTGDNLSPVEPNLLASGYISSVVDAEDMNPFSDPEPTSQGSEVESLSIFDTVMPVSSDLNSSSTVVNDTEMTVAGKILEASTDQTLTSKSGDDVSCPVPGPLWDTVDDPFGNGVNSRPAVPLTTQTNPDASLNLMNQTFGVLGLEENNLSEGGLFNLGGEVSQESPNPFDPPQPQEDIFINVSGDTSSSTVSLSHDFLSASAPAADSFSMLGSQMKSTENQDIFGIGNEFIVPDQARQGETNTTEQDHTEMQSQNLFDLSTPTTNQAVPNDVDFDIFGTECGISITAQSPASNVFGQDGADPFADPYTFSDDIFGMSNNSVSGDTVTQKPSQTNSNSSTFDDFLGLETPEIAITPVAPAQSQSLFIDDTFSSEPVMQPSSAPSNPDMFMDGFLDPMGGNTATTTVTATSASDNSWMDDFLG
ncbi:xin actin-binding repeat-containing protein 1 isoform X4 [Oncorhynchus mykiss]|uniref:Xin actin binding repeat containing 1 n=1 Tax=Oncorhynchus mykiss TaxID=8022 RepID=A0A8C7PIN7_ONCMY|nr:xin actin-binding repeat-containing protein 1 isoform X4 [Oncorhynchus mykiss]